jgi:hypothetical protein
LSGWPITGGRNGEQENRADGSKIYESAGGASLHVYPSPANAGSSIATVAT